nr:hypothetical protein Iba_chr14aCG8600 [Ipomoea batatas]
MRRGRERERRAESALCRTTITGAPVSFGRPPHRTPLPSRLIRITVHHQMSALSFPIERERVNVFRSDEGKRTLVGNHHQVSLKQHQLPARATLRCSHPTSSMSSIASVAGWRSKEHHRRSYNSSATKCYWFAEVKASVGRSGRRVRTALELNIKFDNKVQKNRNRKCLLN